MATTWYRSLNYNAKKFPNALTQIAGHLSYIKNPKKTRDGELVTAINCQTESDALEFVLTQDVYESTTGRRMINPNSEKKDPLCYSIRQAFKEGEVTAEQSHALGLEFAKRLLGDKYQYVVATHVDRGHIHNHIIFNAVSLELDKFHSTPYNYKRLWRISDQICLENGLSIVENPGRSKHKVTYHERNPRISFREELKKTIDISVAQSKTFSEFLEKMQECGYMCKQGKHLAFKHGSNGQQRFIRSYTIGYGYTQEQIQTRIRKQLIPQKSRPLSRKGIPLSFKETITIRMHKQLIQNPMNYTQHKANVMRYTKAIMAIQKHHVTGQKDMEQKVDGIYQKLEDTEKKIQTAEQEIQRLQKLFEHKKVYDKYLPLDQKQDTLLFLNGQMKNDFYREHQQALELFQYAKEQLQKNGVEVNTDITAIKNQIDKIRKEQDRIKETAKNLKQTLQEMEQSKMVIEELKTKTPSKTRERGERNAR